MSERDLQMGRNEIEILRNRDFMGDRETNSSTDLKLVTSID